MVYVITEAREHGPKCFYKRSYDSYNGNWTPYARQAARWQTKPAAEAKAKALVEFYSKTGQGSRQFTVETI